MHETDDMIERCLVGEELSSEEADSLMTLIEDDTPEVDALLEEIELVRLLPVARACPTLSPDHIADKVRRTIELAESIRMVDVPAREERLTYVARFCQVAVTILGVMQAAFFGFLLYESRGLHAVDNLLTLHTALFVTALAVAANLCAEWIVYAEARARLWLTGRWVAPTARAVLFARLQALVVMVISALLVLWQGGVGM